MPEPHVPGKAGDLVIAVMARSPAGPAGAVKTRLAGVVPDPADRVALYTAFLGDTIATCRRVRGATLRVAYTPEGGRAGFAKLGLGETELLPQRGADLGDRMRALFEDLHAAGFRRALIVGSDLPTMPVRHLRAAAAALRHADRTVVLGPSPDGGYYLIGLQVARRPGGPELPDLFSGIRWSTSDTLGDTLAAAARAGWKVALMPSWYDVDDAESLSQLLADLRQPRHAARAPCTAAALRQITIRSA